MTRFMLFPVFFAIIFSLFALLQLYEYRSYRRWLRRVYPPDRHNLFLKRGWLVLGVGNVLVILQFIIRGSNSYELFIPQVTVVYPSGIYFAAVIFGFLILLVKDVVRFVLFWIRRGARLAQQLSMAGSTSVDPPSPAELSRQRRQLLKLGGATTLGVVFGTPLVSTIASPRDYRITKIPIAFPNLPAGLHGLTIAQLSDVHSGIYMTEDHMMEIVELTNSLHANIVALTGDHVDTSDIQIPSVRNAMRMLKSDYGIYGCLGNHDHFATADKVSAALQQVGVVMLDNANRTLTVNGEQFSMIGVDDAGYGRSNFARLDDALKGVDPQHFKILLSHRPEFFPHAKKAGMDLTLAGHTHGGQVGIEFWGINLNPAYLVTKYVRGLFNEEGRQMYVNVGVGMVGVPIRIVRPEITLITLQRAA
jgi:uncharacterized protein